jgi:hypothetical protein
MAFLFVAPIAIALGLAPASEEAFYFTLVALALAWCAMALLMLVFTGDARRRPDAPSRRPVEPGSAPGVRELSALAG